MSAKQKAEIARLREVLGEVRCWIYYLGTENTSLEDQKASIDDIIVCALKGLEKPEGITLTVPQNTYGGQH